MTLTSFDSCFRRVGLSLAFFLSACAVNEAKTPPPPVEQAALPKLNPVAVTAGEALTPIKVDSVPAKTDTAVTTKPSITVPSVAGRSKKDSLALVAAIRAGMKATDAFDRFGIL